MSLIIIFIIAFAFSIIIFSFFNLRLSIAIYVAYLILVPYLQFKVAGFPLSYNLVNSILLLVFIYRFKVEKNISLNYILIKPFLFLYFSLLILSLFTWVTPWSIQFNFWRSSFMQSCILSFIIWNVSLADRTAIHYTKWAIIISVSIASIYGIILMQFNGINPYSSIISNHFGYKDVAEIYSENASRLDFSSAGKIQATMNHPMLWSLVLCFSFILFSRIYSNSKNTIYILLLLVLIAFSVLISGVRTGIAALFLGLIYYLIRIREYKIFLIATLIMGALLIIINTNEAIYNIFISFIDVTGEKSEIGGSSISMRLEQLNGALLEIKGHELTGKGYGWNNYYISLHGDHPVMLAFESLVFIILCNHGFLGMIIWILFLVQLYFSHRKILQKSSDTYLVDAMIVTYISYSIGTGEYNYMPYFTIFYFTTIAYLTLNQKKTLTRLSRNKLRINQ